MKHKISFLVLLLTAVFAVLVFAGCGADSVSLGNTVWVPLKAADASGDEVDLNDIYNTYYSNYQGSLSFEENKTFELWMGPGDPTDGTHTGMYEQKYGKIYVHFDNDAEETFDIRNNGETTLIVVPYGEYEVYFSKQ